MKNAIFLTLVILACSVFITACSDPDLGSNDAGDGDAALGDGSIDDTDSGVCEPRRCEALAKDGKPACGIQSDGCGGRLECGSGPRLGCAPGYVCMTDSADGVNRCEERETQCETIDEAIACEAIECGFASIGCGESALCGSCDEGSSCISGRCVAEGGCDRDDPEAVCAGRCGEISDGCDGVYDCADHGGELCGPGQECGAIGGVSNVCVGEICEPATCTSLGATCGYIPDPCTGEPLNCWPDEMQICEHPNMSCHGDPLRCSFMPEDCEGPLCAYIPTHCGPEQPTRVRGRLTTPDGQLGIPNAIVYIPSSPALSALPPMDEGINQLSRCDRCDDEFDALGSILTATITDAQGNFTLEGAIPVGNGFRIVAKAGRFRAVVSQSIPTSSACEETIIGGALRLPAKHAPSTGQHLPKIAIVSGDADAMECVLLKMGFDREEFSSRGSEARFHLYRGNGGGVHGLYRCIPETVNPSSPCFQLDQQLSEGACEAFPGCMWLGDLPPGSLGDRGDLSVPAAALFDSNPNNGTLRDYDMVIANCPGAPGANLGLNAADVADYLKLGGRLFASHWSYDYLGAAGAYGDMTGAGSSFRDRVYGAFGRPRANPQRLSTYARWLDHHGAALVHYEDGAPIFAMIHDIFDPRDLVRSVSAGVEEWLFRTSTDEEFDGPESGFPPSGPAVSVQQFSFNAPLGFAPEQACGRASYTSFHVMGHDGALSTKDRYFPGYCPPGSALTPQEKSLAYLLFDLAACVSDGELPSPPACAPRTADLCGASECGPRSDGCGGIVDCGGCDGGDYCSPSGECLSSCPRITCEDAGYECGRHSDGCAGVIDCGICTGGAHCGLAQPGQCGECMPLTCSSAEAECGQLDNGCGGVLECGSCGPGRYCGVGNRCEDGEGCTPKTCASEGAACGLIYDGCGGIVDCGACPSGQVCGYPAANRCGSVG